MQGIYLATAFNLVKFIRHTIRSLINLSLLFLLLWGGSSAYAVNYSLDFDGTDDYVDLGDINALDGVSAFSINYWFNISSGDNFSFFNKRRSPNQSLQVKIHPTKGFIIEVEKGSSAFGYLSSFSTTNEWVHAAVVFDGGGASNADKLKLYINGSLQTLAFTGSIPSTTDTNANSMFIGTLESTSGYFNGRMDEISIFNNDLSADEVTALYNSGSPLSASSNSGDYASSTNLIAYYTIDSNSGTGASLTDDSTNSNTGTLTNMVTSGASSDWTAFSTTQTETTQAVTEGGGTDTYTLVLDQQPTSDVTVTITSSDADAATVTSSLTFTSANWNSTQTVTVTPVSDADSTNETVTISHSLSGGGYTGSAVTDVVVTVTDDDPSDSSAPTLSSSSPTDGAGSVAVTSNIVLTFSEAVDVESGDIVLYKADGTVVETFSLPSAKVTGTGSNTITINPTANLSSSTNYYLQIAAAAFDDSASNSYAGIADTTTLNFTTVGSDPTTKTDVTASIKAMSGVAIDAVAMNFNAVEHRVSWLHANVGSNKLSHQGIRLNFANPMVDRIMNTAYVKPSKLKLSDEFLKLIRNNVKEGEAPQVSAMTDDTKQGLSSIAFNEMAKLREDTIDKVLNATGDTKIMGDWNVWTEGRITVGKTYKTDTSSAQDSKTQNLSLGFDRIIKDDSGSDSSGHIIGMVIGIGKSDADTTNNSTVDADNYSLSAYGVIREDDKALAQAMMVYGRINVDKTRKDGSDTLTGAHSANQFFTSLKVQKETIGVGSFSLSPYGKIHASRTWYDGYSEIGGNTALTYGEQTIDSTVLSVGLDVDYSIPIHKGNIRPFMQYEYGADVSGSSTVVMHYNNEITNYQLELDNKADSNWKFVLGADIYTKDEWDSSFSYARTEAVNAGYSDSLAVKVGLRF